MDFSGEPLQDASSDILGIGDEATAVLWALVSKMPDVLGVSHYS